VLQDLIGEEYTAVTGRRAMPVRGMWRHPQIEWAAASPDFRVVGEKRLVEAKRSTSRTRFADGVPQDVEAQVTWALGVGGYPVGDVAALLGDDQLLTPVPEVVFDPELFDYFVTVAQDFRRRLADGGPFSRDAARIRRDHPQDDGSEMVADDELAEAVLELLRLRAARDGIDTAEERIKAAVQTRMADAARLVGAGWTVTWKRTKDITSTDWKSVADGLLRQLPEAQRDALVSLHSTTRPGARPFRVALNKEE
jgi:predicted phage-related endonuclease